MASSGESTIGRLPAACEPAILERFLKAEAMALWAVRAAQRQDVPPNVRIFLERHEADEREHLRRFEALVGHASHRRARLPAVPRQWPSLAVHLYGYEALGLEFARLLAGLRPDLIAILEDEDSHVGFFEREIRTLLEGDGPAADQARLSARAWWRKLPRTVDRYLDAETLAPWHKLLARTMLDAIERRLRAVALLA